MLTTQKIPFSLFHLYDKDLAPINDPEDHSRADPLPMSIVEVPVSQPLSASMNLFYPYLNKSSWRVGDWYWNQGAQKSKKFFRSLVEIISSADFWSEDLCHTSWAAIDCQLGSLGTAHDPCDATPMAADLQEWQAMDGGWMQRNISISVPFPQHLLHPGPRNYTISNFHRQSLVSVIREVLSDPLHCRSFHFEAYSLRWQCSCEVADVGVYGKLFSLQAFTTAHCDLQNARIDSISCTLPCCVVALMFWSDVTQLTAFGDAKLWPLYVCSHAAYFQAVCVPCLVVI